MKLVMVGTGYVGLVSGACFAEFGFETVCVDKDQNRIEKIKKETATQKVASIIIYVFLFLFL